MGAARAKGEEIEEGVDDRGACSCCREPIEGGVVDVGGGVGRFETIGGEISACEADGVGSVLVRAALPPYSDVVLD